MPLSAVAISKMMGTRDAIIVMRLHDMALYFCQTAKMLLKQYVEGGLAAQLGEPGLEKVALCKAESKRYCSILEALRISLIGSGS